MSSYFDYFSLDNIKRHTKSHFFDKGATRFFNSRYPQYGYRGSTKDHRFSQFVFFVTSEQCDHKSSRLYTIRRLNMQTGEVITVGEFRQYKTRATANRNAKKMALESVLYDNLIEVSNA